MTTNYVMDDITETFSTARNDRGYFSQPPYIGIFPHSCEKYKLGGKKMKGRRKKFQ